jgi:carboxymethylenebutenolidase
MTETAVSITTPDGIADGYVYRPDRPGSWPGVLFFTDGVGIRQAKRDMAARLAAAGYIVLLPNPFYRDGPIRDMSHAGKDEDVAEIVARFGKFAMNISKDGGLPRDIKAYLDFLAGQDGVKPGKLGCTGYCMGGNFGLAAAGQFPGQVAAAASFHGGSLATDSPASPHRLAHAMRGEVAIYIGVAEIDPYLKPGETARLQGALEGAAVSHVMELYEGAEHGFTVPGNDQYLEAAAARHWTALLGFLEQSL